MIYIGVDPGVHECGVAIEWPRERRAFLVRGTLAIMLRDIHRPLPEALGFELSVCVEGQQFYGTERSKGDPQDLIRLAQVAGAVLGTLVHRAHDYAIPLPRVWKGNTPKDIHHARLARDYPQWVEPVAAHTPKSKQHHVWDAVGLPEWHKERLIK